MIVKVLSRHSPSSIGSLVNYVTRPEKGKGSKPPVVITHNLRSNDPIGWKREFMENEGFRKITRSDQVMMRHEIVSFSHLDTEKITQEALEDITHAYIRLRGENGQYLASIHADQHLHIHFAISPLEFRTGKSFHISPNELATLKQELQAYQQEKYPELEHSLPDHGAGKPQLTNQEWQLKQRTQRSLVKEELAAKVKACHEQAATRQEFLDLLQQEGLHHYERKGEPTGIVFEDMKFRFTRLGMEKEAVQQLLIDKSQEQQALEEIQSIREATLQQERELDDFHPTISH